jgi:hypothetical protein
MTLTVVALFVFIFGAYSYGYLTILSLRDRTVVWAPHGAPEALRRYAARVSLAMFVTCTVWFVLHATIAFGDLLGNPPQNDLVDLATLELVFLFPGLIFHAYLLESTSDQRPFDRAGRWRLLSWFLYAAGVGCAAYFTAAIFRVIPAPQPVNAYIGGAIAALFIIASVGSMAVMGYKPRAVVTKDQKRLEFATRLLFVGMIAAFLLGNTLQSNALLNLVNVGVRTTPLFFLLVSVYFESRIEFYDLVIKRGVLLMMGLLMTGAVLALSLPWIDSMPPGAARPWLFAVVLLPVAMLMPWMHDRAGRLLDRLWFGRKFSPEEAVRHVLSAMQAATDERSLTAAAETALQDIFRRRVEVSAEPQAPAPQVATAVEVRTTSNTIVRLAITGDRGSRALLSEDLALLRSLGAVFGFMLENIRLQRKRQEQEQLAQELRLQSSRSELKALRAQINPHFLFNALNAIASLIHTDPARADAAVEQLAEVFRYTLRRSDQEWAPLDQELAFARAYLDVEQARFGTRLAYTITCDPPGARAQVPSMLLQTLVENAVKHGISRLRTSGRIDVRATVRDRRVTLHVRDTGPGPGAGRDAAARGEGFGLRSVRDRLEGHFGTDASLDLRREGDTTVAEVELPLIEDFSAVTGVVR